MTPCGEPTQAGRLGYRRLAPCSCRRPRAALQQLAAWHADAAGCGNTAMRLACGFKRPCRCWRVVSASLIARNPNKEDVSSVRDVGQPAARICPLRLLPGWGGGGGSAMALLFCGCAKNSAMVSTALPMLRRWSRETPGSCGVGCTPWGMHPRRPFCTQTSGRGSGWARDVGGSTTARLGVWGGGQPLGQGSGGCTTARPGAGV